MKKDKKFKNTKGTRETNSQKKKKLRGTTVTVRSKAEVSLIRVAPLL